VNRPALLDVNLLIALFDPTHVHHDVAHDWFADRRASGWATSPVTELGFVRVLSNPALADSAERASTLLAHLRRFCASGHHEFWPETLSLRDPKTFDLSLVSHRQLTDIYLLAVAARRGGRLATFDRTIPVNAVLGATVETLEVLSPGEY
jgi:uncharacterized protein